MFIFKQTRLLLLATALLWGVEPVMHRVLAATDDSGTAIVEVDREMDEIDFEKVEADSLGLLEEFLPVIEVAFSRQNDTLTTSSGEAFRSPFYMRGPPAV